MSIPEILLYRPFDSATAPAVKRKSSISPVCPASKRKQTSQDTEVQGSLDAASLATHIRSQLDSTVPNETVHKCSKSLLAIIRDRPGEVLAVAHQKLHTWPYQDVPVCWRRLYEDASLYKAAKTFDERAGAEREAPCDDWLDEVVSTLDTGLTLSGGPGRSDVFESCFKLIDESFLKLKPARDGLLDQFNINPPQQLDTACGIPKSDTSLSFLAFQQHLDDHASPMIIPDGISDWPALKYWQRPSNLLQHTLGGRRLIPVEIGRSYVDSNWSQKLMPFKEFMETYLWREQPIEIAYLAQHDLFAQIPALRNDIRVPDYCYTSPPDADVYTARTAGLSTVAPLESPLLNAWLGPARTTTPLHTDPYHNILAQVVGYKYIRLYPPHETSKLYPRGVDAKGINLENTSSVDVGLARPLLVNTKDYMNPEADDDGISDDLDAARRQQKEEYPLFAEAKYLEAVLAPGECLYIPLGWWHYVESLSTSFSVSFWWN